MRGPGRIGEPHRRVWDDQTRGAEHRQTIAHGVSRGLKRVLKIQPRRGARFREASKGMGASGTDSDSDSDTDQVWKLGSGDCELSIEGRVCSPGGGGVEVSSLRRVGAIGLQMEFPDARSQLPVASGLEAEGCELATPSSGLRRVGAPGLQREFPDAGCQSLRNWDLGAELATPPFQGLPQARGRFQILAIADRDTLRTAG